MPVAAAWKDATDADNRGLRMILRKEWAPALAHYQEAVRRFPGHAPLWRNLASLYVLRKDPAGAVRALEGAVRLDPAQVYSWRLLRELMMKEGEGRAWLGRAAFWWRRTHSPEAFRAWAGALVRLHRFSQAEKLMDRRPAGVPDFRLSFPGRTAQGTPHPLFLLITLDTFRADLLDSPATPFLTGLASESHSFRQFISAVPITLPAHASMLTGLYPNHHGVRDNSIYRLSPGARTQAESFRAAGWATSAHVSAFILDRMFGLEQGFETYGDRFVPDKKGSRFPESRRAGETLAAAAGHLAKLAQGQAFAWIHLYDTHAPYEPPFPFDEAWPDRPYAGEAAYMDYALGQFVRTLREDGRWDRTTLVVAGDHGESLGEHREATHGFLLYRSTLHVPLFIHLPGQTAGKVHPQGVSSVDLFPTILRLAGLPAPPSDGRDLFAPEGERAIYSETQIPLPFGWSDLYRVQKGGAAFIGPPSGKAFDLVSDPGEVHPLGSVPAGLAALVDGYRADRRGLNSETSALDDESLAKLKSLGYAHAGATPAMTELPLPDPETKMESLLIYQRALAAEEDGDMKTLGKWTRALAEKEAGNPSILAFCAEWFHKAGDEGRAASVLRDALKLDPRHPQALFYSGLMDERAGRLVSAEGAYKVVLEVQPNHFSARYNLSRVFLMEKKWAEGERAMEEILKRLPDHAYTLNNLAYLYWARDKACSKALEFARKANAIKPDDPALQESLLSTLRNCGKDDEAGRLEKESTLLSLAPAPR
jgi:arylsulfatase A-like enzyme/Flp pilus assembly protein TadD